MIEKRDFVGFVLVTYLILLTLFFAYRDNESSQDISVCTHRVACVRFCCHDHESCSTKFLKTNFNKSLIPADEDGKVEDFKYFFGRPDCPILEPLEMKWKFTSHGLIVSGETERKNYFYYESERYCLDYEDEKGVIKWKPLYCSQNSDVYLTLHSILMIASVIVLAITTVVNCLSPEMKTIAGKSEVAFLLSMLLFHICLPLIKREIYGHMSFVLLLMLISILLTYMWLSVLTFDIWWTFKHREAATEDSSRFKLYCLFTFGTIAVDMILFSVFKNSYNQHIKYVSLLLLLCYLAMAIADIIFLVLTSVLVFRMSKSTRSTDHSWFEAKKERYFAYLGLYAVMIITWPVEIYSLDLFYSFESKIISDVIKLFSVAVIFVILSWKKLASLTQRNSINYSLT